jgi:hypothetical protein
MATDGLNYENARPIEDNIRRINSFYDEGHYIIYHTGRGTLTGEDWRRVTECQLNEFGAKYHELIMGKPAADIYIDDRAVNIEYLRGGV